MLIGDRVAEEKQGSLCPVHNTVNESWSGSFIVLRKTNVFFLPFPCFHHHTVASKNKKKIEMKAVRAVVICCWSEREKYMKIDFCLAQKNNSKSTGSISAAFLIESDNSVFNMCSLSLYTGISACPPQ